jgi:hypothetical protein
LAVRGMVSIVVYTNALVKWPAQNSPE